MSLRVSSVSQLSSEQHSGYDLSQVYEDLTNLAQIHLAARLWTFSIWAKAIGLLYTCLGLLYTCLYT